MGTARFGVSEVPKILDVILYVASDDTTPGGANIGYVKTQISSRIVTTFVYEWSPPTPGLIIAGISMYNRFDMNWHLNRNILYTWYNTS